MVHTDFWRLLPAVVVCFAVLTSGCAEAPETSLAAAHRAWSTGDEAGLYQRMTVPSAGMMRLLAYCDGRFRVVPRDAAEVAPSPAVDVPEGVSTLVTRLPTASGTVPIRLAREGRAWRIDLVATEALSRDDGGRGVAP